LPQRAVSRFQINDLRILHGRLSRMRARIEAASPFPRIGVVGIPGALGNRADVNIAVINAPALLTVCGSAAGEGGACRIEARSSRKTNPVILRPLGSLSYSRLAVAGLMVPHQAKKPFQAQ
jgi:hypothetical protein